MNIIIAFSLIFSSLSLVVALSFDDLDIKKQVSSGVVFGYNILEKVQGQVPGVRLGIRTGLPPTGYLALGAVPVGSSQMIGAKNIVIAIFKNETDVEIAEYDLNGKSPADIVKSQAAGYKAGTAEVTYDANTKMVELVFERDVKGVAGQPDLALDGENGFLFATNNVAELAYHSGGKAGYFTANFASIKCVDDCSLKGECSADGVCSCLPAYDGDHCQLCKEGYEKDDKGVCNLIGGESVSTPKEVLAKMSDKHIISAAGGDYELHWEIDDANKEIVFVTKVKTEGWIAVGIGGPNMVSNEVVIGRMDEDNKPVVKTFEIDSKSSAGVREAADQTISNFGVEQGGGETIMTFRRKFVIAGDDSKVSLEGSANFAWAFANSNSLTSRHAAGSKGSLSIEDFGSGQASSSTTNIMGKLNAHGAFMFIGWWVCITLGTFSASYMRHKGAMWFKTHMYVQLIGIVLVLIAFFIAVSMVTTHFSTAHSKMGLYVIIMGILQCLAAFFRPAPDAGQIRTIFKIVHLANGAQTIFFAFITTIIGLDHAHAAKWVKAMFALWVIGIAAAIGFGEWKLRPLRNGGKDTAKGADVSDGKGKGKGKGNAGSPPADANDDYTERSDRV